MYMFASHVYTRLNNLSLVCLYLSLYISFYYLDFFVLKKIIKRNVQIIYTYLINDLSYHPLTAPLPKYFVLIYLYVLPLFLLDKRNMPFLSIILWSHVTFFPISSSGTCNMYLFSSGNQVNLDHLSVKNCD